MMKKKGEITTQQLVMLIVLIVSFAVILFFILRLDFGNVSNDQVCHNSVILKSSGRGLAGALDCKTSYVCISGGEECEGISATETIEVDSRQEVMKAIADEMADCWWMFGEGELDYIGTLEGGLIQEKTFCAICSIVKFDEKIQEDYEAITYKNLLDYFSSNNINEGETYLRYLYDISQTIDLNQISNTIKQDYEINRDIGFDKKYIIITGQSSSPQVVETFRSFAKSIKKIFVGDEQKETEIAEIFPYFVDNQREIEPTCDVYITQA